MGPTSGGEGTSSQDLKTPKSGFKAKRRSNTLNFTPLQVKKIKNMVDVQTTISTNNRFMINSKPLSDYQMDDTASTYDDNSNDKNSQQEKRNMKNPPVIITGSNVNTIQNMCNEIIKSKKFEIRLLRIGVRLQIMQKDEFDAICDYLSKNSFNYFKYHTADTRPRKIILYGLYEMHTDELRKILSSYEIVPTDIKTLKLRQNKYEYDKQSVYLLYFEPGKIKLSTLREIKYINNVVVKWEPYHPRSQDKIPQCRNCQMFGHSSINCEMPTKCLVCAESHKTDNCPKRISRTTIEHNKIIGKQIDSSFIKCANCNENHTASYRGCIARMSYIEIQSKYKRTKNQRRTPQYNHNPNDYPDLCNSTAPNSYQFSQRQNNSYSHVVQQQNEVNMQQFMINMMTTFNNLIDKLSTMIGQLTRSISLITQQQP